MNSVRLTDDDACFQKVVLPHLDDAYGLARWLTGNRSDAEEVVQEACLRAFRRIGDYRHSNSRVWVLAIVHRAACDWLQKNRPPALVAVEDSEGAEDAPYSELDAETPAMAVTIADPARLETSIAAVPSPFRETIVLREILGLSYRDIAEVTGAPTGAVVWRLAEARHKLLVILATIAPDCGRSRQTRYDQQPNVIV
jgi:RNA polymerase sigma factor (sigma-70 family)